jgi:hypothetical protein
MYTRKRIDLKLPCIILENVEKICFQKAINRTNYIETLIRFDLKKRGLIIDEQPKKYYGSFEEWGWDDSKIKRKKF